MSDCIKCRGKGKISGCPQCGKIKNITGIEKTDKELESVPEVVGMIEPRNRYNSVALQQIKMANTTDKIFEAYCRKIDDLIEKAKLGVTPAKSIVVTSPNGFGKSILLKTLRYYYIKTGRKVASMRTLEEFSLFYNSYFIRGKERALDKLESLLNSEILILNVMQPELASTVSNIQSLLNFCEEYEIPVIISASAQLTSLFSNVSSLHDTSLSYKFPAIFSYWTQ